MPVERRNLRSNKPDNSSSAGGEKPRANSSSSNPKKEKPTHSRSTSSRSKPALKKTTSASSKDMSGDKGKDESDTPQENGNINGVNDIVMDEEPSQPAKPDRTEKDNDGDEEMTVVVPPPKGSKASQRTGLAKEVDAEKNGEPDDAEDSLEGPPKDPKEKAIEGKSTAIGLRVATNRFLPRHQEQFRASRASCQPI